MESARAVKKLRYHVAMTLDGFIAGPNGEYDWIPNDPAIDFAALFKRFDTAVMGRLTFETMLANGESGALPGMKTYVFSRTLRQRDYPLVTLTDKEPADVVRMLKAQPDTGKEIWLFGGGVLFRGLLDAGLVDAVEVAIVPVMLGGGIPMLPPGTSVLDMRLENMVRYPSGIVILSYSIPPR